MGEGWSVDSESKEAKFIANGCAQVKGEGGVPKPGHLCAGEARRILVIRTVEGSDGIAFASYINCHGDCIGRSRNKGRKNHRNGEGE